LNRSQLHADFQLNGISLTEKSLDAYAHHLINEGEVFEKAVGSFLLKWIDDSAYLSVQTSGSTGAPKRIRLQKQQMVNSAKATGNYFGLKPSDKAFLCLSADYIAGKMMLVRAMVLGLHIDCMSPSSNPLQDNAKKYQFGAMVPMQLSHSLDHIEAIEKLIVGGAPVSFHLRQKLQAVGCSVFETYGMTETISHIAVRSLNHRNNSRAHNYFKALPNVKFSIDNRNCLRILAPEVSDAAVLTNDMVNLISENEFEWLGRIDHVINSGGIKLFPEQIESKLAAMLKARFFVAGIPDEKLGQRLVLILEAPTIPENFIENLKKAKVLQKFEIPKEVLIIPKFVETATAKVNRKESLKLLIR